MHAFVASLTTFTLIIHGLIGCCWRLAPSDSQDGANTCLVAGACCPSERGDGQEHDESPCSPSPGRSQCHGVCTYLSPERTSVDQAPLELSFDSVAAVESLTGGQLVASVRDPAAAVPCEPPLRLHLLNQLLLI
ncbi:MAG: hypothetical protein WD669_00895 [Pirellulales bacterium]